MGARGLWQAASRTAGPVVLLGLVYWATARLSLSLALIHGQVTPIWPPTGLALVGIFLLGRRAVAGIFLAAFAVNLPIGPSPLGAALIAAGNSLAPLAAAEILKLTRFHPAMDRLQDAASVILAALAGMTVSASIGSGVLMTFGSISPAQFWSSWAVWWTGDAMGILLVGPLLFSLLLRPLPSLSWSQRIELSTLLLGTGLVTYVLFQNRLRLEYLVFPLIMATAWRFKLTGAAPAALIASGVAILSAVHGTGPFASEGLAEKMITLQVFNVSLAFASFVLAAFVEERQRREEVTRMYMSAKLASEAKSGFLNLAAHELRTPISVLNGYLSMLEDGSLGPIPPSLSRLVEVLHAKTQELKEMVDRLLEAARLDGGTSASTTSAVDMNFVVREAVERARPRADMLKAEIAFAPYQAPAIVGANAEQLGRIMDNLINNALTYTNRLPRIRIAIACEGSNAVVRVADNGVGVPDDQRDLIFERFHRGNNPAFSNVPGTGLGLYISRQLAETNGARLSIESSTPEGGTVFSLTLPVRATVAAPVYAALTSSSGRPL